MLGFHGTSRAIAHRLVGGEPFRCSAAEGDWLGYGAYFFVDFPGQRIAPGDRALSYARKRHGDDAVVVYTEINDDEQLDLLTDDDAQDWLRDVYQRIEPALRPRQAPGAGLHRLDAYVIDYACELMEQAGGQVRSVLGLLDEYPPLYPATALVADPHVQVAVRDLSAIDDPAIW